MLKWYVSFVASNYYSFLEDVRFLIVGCGSSVDTSQAYIASFQTVEAN